MLRRLPKLALPALSFVLMCGFRCDPEVPIGEDDDAGTSDAGSLQCAGENPAGCTSDEDCGGISVCITGTRPSACSCDASTGTWACTPDVLGGDCVTETCTTASPAGCTSNDQCGEGLRCQTGTKPSACTCDPATGDWGCTRDLGGGDCVSTDCPDASEPGVSYVGSTPTECAAILFGCDEGETSFDGDCGCGCIAPATPDCGDVSCDYSSQYCDVFIGGAPGSGTSYSCQPLPSACASAPSCAACFPSGPGDCEERPEGLRYTLAGA